MKYALGNMLNGAGGLNADQLALDLQFAADKTLTARKGPTPVLTRGSTGTFVGSNGLIQTAAVNAARFDHDPVSPFACRGLLMEEGRTNLTIRSDDFGASEWNDALQRNLTVTANDTTSPSGATDADLLTVGATTTVYQAVQRLPAISGNVTSGTAYTVSCYFKPNQVTRVSIWAGNTTTLPVDAIFNLTGAGSVVANAFGTASIQQLQNGWYRCIVTGTAGATSNTTLRIGPATGTSRTYVGNSVDSFWAWGVQLEAGSFPTSYIPTTTSALARAADVCSITGAAFSGLYNNAAGTLLSEASIANLVGNNRGIVQIDDDLTNNFIRHVYGLTDGGFRSLIRANLDAQTQLSVIAGTASTIQKRVVAYEGTSFASSSNGASVETATRTMPVGLNNIKIGYLFTGLFYLNGHIQSIRYYKKRLPNAKLQALTA